MFKKEKGITLVALVITIVVLIILAGISISMMLGQGGLIQKSIDGANSYKDAAKNEDAQLNQVNTILNGILDNIYQ